mmetsp:Transcript_14898/g.30304  ORF Transcript_14898/g.30304 Transcript_14898/m.30304 type:complete len:89 (+) Transcript_14898:816-1082(+)
MLRCSSSTLQYIRFHQTSPDRSEISQMQLTKLERTILPGFQAFISIPSTWAEEALGNVRNLGDAESGSCGRQAWEWVGGFQTGDSKRR